MITLHNDYLTVEIKTLGAELHSIKRNDRDHEYLWQGDPASWNRQAPILFPFVGRLKDDQYTYNGKTYHQTQHGFARDREFTILEQSDSAVTMYQTDDEKTRQAFPFSFKLTVTYQLQKDHLHIAYTVENRQDDQTMIYGIGAHPGFNVPFEQGESFETTQLTVDPAVVYHRVPLVGPYNDAQAQTTLDMHSPLLMNHQLFDHDALIFDLQGQSFSATLSDRQQQHGITVLLPHNMYMGVWSPYPNFGNFICMEPWWSIADSLQSNGRLEDKMGMHRLDAHQSDHYELEIHPF